MNVESNEENKLSNKTETEARTMDRQTAVRGAGRGLRERRGREQPKNTHA